MKEWEERLGRIEAIMAETAKRDEERAKSLDRLEKAVEKTTNSVFGVKEELKGIDIEAIMAETAKRDEERAKSLDRLEKAVEKTTNSVFGVKEELKGIAKSNGMVSEEYFYNTLSESMTFGENHFDLVESNKKRKCRDKNGKPVETEYDILMINKAAACIFEAKYRAQKDHIDELLEKVGKFRIQFPDCANHKIYLGIGALSFDPGVENAAKAHGIGIMKQNGDALEIYDKDLKAY